MTQLKAAAVKFPFWQDEFDQMINWFVEGKSWEEIRAQVVDRNAFRLPSLARRKSLFSAIQRRVVSLSPRICEVYTHADLETQRLINLIGIMNTDGVMKAFILHPFRDELMLDDQVLEPNEMEAFFRQLETDHEEVASWTDITIHRLQRTIRNYLREAGLAKGDGDNLQIIRPLLDPQLRIALIDEGHEDYVRALTER